MPWGVKTVEEKREEFVLAARERGNITAACQEFGITRRTGYKWLGRANAAEAGSAWSSDESRAPKHVANKTRAEKEALILEVRAENPAWGGKKIRQVLENEGYDALPCVRTCSNILKRNGCIEEEESRKHQPWQRFERERCNELWQADFKGDFALGDGSRCFPLTTLDDHTRFSIMVDPKPNTLGVKDSFEQAFYTYGMPDAILSDNGCQFAGFKGGYTSFERWLMDHDVLPIHGRIMHPQTQGKIERFHRTMNQELLRHHTFSDLDDATAQLAAWRRRYNEERPHEALGMKPPAQLYVPSTREYRSVTKPFEYSGEYPVRKTNNWGYLRFGPVRFFLSETMADQHLEIRPGLQEDTFLLCYRNFVIAQVDAPSGKLLNRKVRRL
jgi:transposase InsO family protein